MFTNTNVVDFTQEYLCTSQRFQSNHGHAGPRPLEDGGMCDIEVLDYQYHSPDLAPVEINNRTDFE
jgi:hypothetical protein